MTITVHTGCAGDVDTIKVDWFDHDNVRHEAVIEIAMLSRDKPRTLQIRVDGKPVAEYVPSQCAPGGLHTAVLESKGAVVASDMQLMAVAKAASLVFQDAEARCVGHPELSPVAWTFLNHLGAALRNARLLPNGPSRV